MIRRVDEQYTSVYSFCPTHPGSQLFNAQHIFLSLDIVNDLVIFIYVFWYQGQIHYLNNGFITFKCWCSCKPEKEKVLNCNIKGNSLAHL